MKCINIVLALLFVSAFFSVPSAEARKKKNVPCHYMYESDIPVPTFAGAGYSWYLLETCDQEWNGDFLRFQNKYPDKYLELRQEKGKPIMKVKQTELNAWYTLGNDVIAVQINGIYTLVDLKTGKQTPTEFDKLASSFFSGAPAPGNNFLWKSGGFDSSEPIPAYSVNSDGTVGEAFPDSDMRRAAFERGQYCDGAAFNAAIPAERMSSQFWTELRRVATQGSVDLTPAGNPQANCDKFNYHLFAGKRASDGVWQLLSGQDGAVFDPATTYATVEAAIADAQPAALRWNERYNQAVQADAQKKAAEEAAVAKAEADRQAVYDIARAKVKELQAQNNFEGATKHAEMNLPSKEWGLAMIEWRDAPLSEIERAISRNQGEPSLYFKGGLGPLMVRLHALRECDKIKPSQFELNGDYSFTMNYGPKKRTLNEIYTDLAYAQKTQNLGVNERWVYDVRANEWKKVHASPGESVPTFVNVPTEEEDAAARNATGQSRVQAYYSCVTSAQLAD